MYLVDYRRAGSADSDSSRSDGVSSHLSTHASSDGPGPPTTGPAGSPGTRSSRLRRPGGIRALGRRTPGRGEPGRRRPPRRGTGRAARPAAHSRAPGSSGVPGHPVCVARSWSFSRRCMSVSRARSYRVSAVSARRAALAARRRASLLRSRSRSWVFVDLVMVFRRPATRSNASRKAASFRRCCPAFAFSCSSRAVTAAPAASAAFPRLLHRVPTTIESRLPRTASVDFAQPVSRMVGHDRSFPHGRSRSVLSAGRATEWRWGARPPNHQRGPGRNQERCVPGPWRVSGEAMVGRGGSWRGG